MQEFFAAPPSGASAPLRADPCPGRARCGWPTRKTCVSTAIVGSPKATFSTTFAVLRPTPGSASSASRVRGTSPPCCSSRSFDIATTFFALMRKRPMVLMYSISFASPERGDLRRRVGDREELARWRGSRPCRWPAPRGSPRPAARRAWRARARSSGRASPSRRRRKNSWRLAGLIRRPRAVAACSRASRARRKRAELEALAREVRVGQRGDGLERDAVDRAGRDAQLAAGAPRRDHRVHELRGADDRVHRAGLDALGAADADRLVDDRDLRRAVERRSRD